MATTTSEGLEACGGRDRLHGMHLALVSASIVAGLASEGPRFVDRSDEFGCRPDGSRVAFCDVDGDGWTDVRTEGAIWRNEGGRKGGARRFERIEAPGSGLVADLDGDGVGDLVNVAPLGVLRGVRNDDGIRFEAVVLPELPETVVRGAAIADLDGDGDLDVYLGGYEDWKRQLTFPSLLLLQDGPLRFRIASAVAERRARGVTACDFDEDGDVDVYVSNYRLQPNALLVNDGRGGLRDEAPARGAVATTAPFAGGHSIGACFGDFDSDGRIDLFAGNFAHVDARGDQPKSRFLRNRGPEAGWTFEDLGPCGVNYQESYASPACADVDNDGWLDLYFTTVYAVASFEVPNHPVLLRNLQGADRAGPWSFGEVSAAAGLGKLPPTYQAAFADLDRDGRVDLVTAGRLWMNATESGGRWVAIRLRGDGRRVHRDAIGAQVRIDLPDGRTITRTVECGTGEGNANGPILHFGLGMLGSESPARPLVARVRWPDGSLQEVALPGLDRQFEVVQASSPGSQDS